MLKGRVLFGLLLIGVGGYAAFSARHWTFKAALFPLTVSIPLIVLAAVQVILDLLGKREIASGAAVDMEASSNAPPARIAIPAPVASFLLRLLPSI